VSIAVAYDRIGRTELCERLTAAHRLRSEAVAKLPADHPVKPELEAFIRERGDSLSKLLHGRAA
jgi:hypothetical protein